MMRDCFTDGKGLVMAKAIDRAFRRELISQAAERLWQRLGAPPGDGAAPLACPTCGARREGREARSIPERRQDACPT